MVYECKRGGCNWIYSYVFLAVWEYYSFLINSVAWNLAFQCKAEYLNLFRVLYKIPWKTVKM